MLRATEVRRAQDAHSPDKAPVVGTASLQHDDRHIRRKTISLTDGRRVLVDLPNAVVLSTGDDLILEDGDAVRIEAADEDLYEVRARDAMHLVELAWHIGNRHLPAAIAAHHILIGRDHVIRAMLEGLGASVRDVQMPFDPVRGAYAAAHAEGHHAHGGHDHGSAGRHHHHAEKPT